MTAFGDMLAAGFRGEDPSLILGAALERGQVAAGQIHPTKPMVA